MLVDPVFTFAHQGAQYRRRGVEQADLILLDDIPEAVGIGVGGHALEHHVGGAESQRPVDDVAVAGDPADVRGAPEGVLVLGVEDPLEGLVGVKQVTGLGVHHALGFAGGTGGVEHEQRVFAVQGLGLAVVGHVLGADLILPPGIAALGEVDFVFAALHHQGGWRRG